MLTGSTSALRSWPALSSQLTCGLLRNSAHFARRHSIAPARSPCSSISTSQSLLEEQSVAVATSSGERPSVRLLPFRPPVRVPPSSSRPSVSSGPSAFSAGKSSARCLAGIDSRSDTRGRQQPEHAQRTQVVHKAPRHTKRKCPAQRRRTLLWIMLTAKSPQRAWAAYQNLLSYGATVPPHLLHQLVRLLASIKPRTRTVHLQLLSVLKMLQGSHGQLRLWEWNTLIDSAGKHWHKTRLEDYEHALDVFNKKGALSTPTDGALDAKADVCVAPQGPDIWTYNILLSIASRSNSPLAIRHASSLLLASGLSPNRQTHLCLLRYFAVRKDLHSVRSTLRKMTQQGLEVGLDGINACLWAYARNGRFDVALPIYRVLRSHVQPIYHLGEHDTEDDSCYIRETLGLAIPHGLEPNEITYTMMIQAHAYHGDLGKALGVFVDMLSTPNREAVARAGTTAAEPACYKPSMAAFRGLFLGFARHGRDARLRTVKADPVASLFTLSQVAWDQDTLEIIFAAFLQLPSVPKPTGRLLYWILVAFGKTSSSDTAKLREVWTELEGKYGGGWRGRLEDIRRSIFTSDDPEA